MSSVCIRSQLPTRLNWVAESLGFIMFSCGFIIAFLTAISSTPLHFPVQFPTLMGCLLHAVRERERERERGISLKVPFIGYWIIIYSRERMTRKHICWPSYYFTHITRQTPYQSGVRFQQSKKIISYYFLVQELHQAVNAK
uniref:Uncharacterized protein n=1 Tax=Nelumbo nucifera TaxID=4432 RepID=A0A822YIY8_NELNU|nr:TPA_asm: hypothetical protein HUJ06_009737 [Nelumbo nucifera]